MIELFNFTITINFGKNPKNGGNPPIDIILLKINIFIFIILFFRNIWFNKFIL